MDNDLPTKPNITDLIKIIIKWLIPFIICIIFLLRYIKDSLYCYPTKCIYREEYDNYNPNLEFIIDNTLYSYSSKPISNIRTLDIIILYFHGNAGNIYQRIPFFQIITKKLDNKYALIAFDYRGFGMSPGKTTQSNMLKDGLTVTNWIKKTFPQNKIIYYGESIGSSILAHSSLYNKPDAIILKSPFSSMCSLISDMFYIPKILSYMIIGNDFTTEKWLENYKGPIVIFYNNMDTLIPKKNIITLMQKYKSIEIQGDHNDCNIDKTWIDTIRQIL
jgi:hypothetical protein